MHPLPSIRRNSHQRQSALIWVCFSRHEPPTGYISVPDSKQTRMQTIIHAGPRQHKWFGTENVLNHTSNTSLTHMNESLVSVVLTLALEPLFPKAPVKTKKASQRKCINSEQQVQCWHGLLVRSHHPSTHPSIHPSIRGQRSPEHKQTCTSKAEACHGSKEREDISHPSRWLYMWNRERKLEQLSLPALIQCSCNVSIYFCSVELAGNRFFSAVVVDQSAETKG